MIDHLTSLGPMRTSLHWTDVVMRLAVTVVAGLLIDYNRGEHGKAAGMRTTLLVCLAASVAMIQVNVLLPTVGRAEDSFVMNDLMWLPLGILTGVGFIGGGAILRRGNIIVGVTTAATLWLVTVIGLCVGGGQIGLGLAATILGLFALWVMKWIEDGLRRERRAHFSIEANASGPSEAEIRRRLGLAGLSIKGFEVMWAMAGARRTLNFEVQEFRSMTEIKTPDLINELALEPGVTELKWRRNSDTVD
jgi:putative Mg2+ transporter-C (MgtC) family protein